ncbi:hypothetical protein BIWAKO_00140 [Bosea sp. BIWAKO-01]|nr:hypothetical protein BIWAKO_00140 [Bosea sp. BIWAKO-01]
MVLQLNQQQSELLGRALAATGERDVQALVKLALREAAAKRASANGGSARQ